MEMPKNPGANTGKGPENSSNNNGQIEDTSSIEHKRRRLAEHYQILLEANFYKRLGISREATNEEIDKIIRKKAGLYHPDNKQEELREIYGKIFSLYTEASNTLLDPDQRRKYDAKLAYQEPSSPPNNPSPRQYPNNPPPPPRPQPKQETRQESGPELKKQAIAEILAWLRFFSDLDSFIKQRDLWVKRGVVTKEEINKLPEVTDAGIKIILSAMNFSGILGFKRARDEWDREGIIPKVTINKNPQVKNFAFEDTFNSLRFSGVNTFVMTRNNWITEGVLTAQEINSLKEKLIKEKVVTPAEADAIFKKYSPG